MKTVTEYLISLVQQNDLPTLRTACQKLIAVQARYTEKGYAAINYSDVACDLLYAAILSKLDNAEMASVFYRSGVTETSAGFALLQAQNRDKSQQLTELLKLGVRLNKECRQSAFYREQIPEEVKAKLEARIALEDALLALNQAPAFFEAVTHARENAINEAIYKCAFAYPAMLADFIMDITRHLRSNPLSAANWQLFRTAVEKLPKNWCEKYIDYDAQKLKQYHHPEQKEERQPVPLPDAIDPKIQEKADEVINALLNNIGTLGSDDDDDNSLNVEEIKWYFVTKRKVPESPKNAEIAERVSRILILTKSAFDFYLQQPKLIAGRELTKEESVTVTHCFRQACKVTLLKKTAQQTKNSSMQEKDALPLPGFLDGKVTKLESIKHAWDNPFIFGATTNYQRAALAPFIYIQTSELIDASQHLTGIPAQLLLFPLTEHTLNSGMGNINSLFACAIKKRAGSDVLRVLLDNGADMKGDLILFSKRGYFEAIAASGDLESVKLFVEYGAKDENAKALCGPISYYKRLDFKEDGPFKPDPMGITTFLLGKFNYTQAQLDDALSDAIESRELEIAELLVNKGANVNAYKQLPNAVVYENIKVIQFLLKHNVNIYQTNGAGKTALQFSSNIEIKKLIRAAIPTQAKSLGELIEFFFDAAFVAKVADSPLIDYLRMAENAAHPKRLTAADSLFWCQRQFIKRDLLCTNAKLQMELTAVMIMDAELLKTWLSMIVKNHVKNPFNFSAWQECKAILEKVLSNAKDFAELLVELKNYRHRETPLEKQAESSSSSSSAPEVADGLSVNAKSNIRLIVQREIDLHIKLIAKDEKQIPTLLALFAPKLCRDANESFEQGTLQVLAKKLLKQQGSEIQSYLANPMPMGGFPESQVELAREYFLEQLAMQTKALQSVAPELVLPHPPRDEPSLDPGAIGFFGERPAVVPVSEDAKKVASLELG